MDWILANKDWVFSGCGVAVFGYIFSVFLRNRSDQGSSADSKNSVVNITNNNTLNGSGHEGQVVNQRSSMNKNLANYKEETRILFIDDDVRFKVAKILGRSGWKYTKVIKDATTLDDAEILEADILFIDVQGVGVSLGFSDEGLGLALAVKEKYPKKKVVIYSAETQGNRFHSALRKADSFLPKNADPYEFQRIVEEFTIGVSDK
jgi:hypothetical protein